MTTNGRRFWVFAFVPLLSRPLDPRVRGDDEWGGCNEHFLNAMVYFLHRLDIYHVQNYDHYKNKFSPNTNPLFT